MMFPYSITGLTRDLYKRSIISALVYSKDLQIIPRSLFALATTDEQYS